MASCLPYAREACRSGLESGDFLYAAYGAATEAWPAMLSTQDLGRFVEDYSGNLALIQRLKAGAFADSLKLLLNWARALQGKTRAPLSLSDETLDESPVRRDLPRQPVLHGHPRRDPAAALLPVRRSRRGARGRTDGRRRGAPTLRNDLADRVRVLERSHARRRRTPRPRRNSGPPGWPRSTRRGEVSPPWPSIARENFLCQSLLLAAEMERIAGRAPAAQELYEQAIACAEDTALLRQQALANELLRPVLAGSGTAPGRLGVPRIRPAGLRPVGGGGQGHRPGPQRRDRRRRVR